MSLHIKTLQVPVGDDTLFVDLQYAKDTQLGYVVRARITRQKRRGLEKFVGFATINKGGELCRFGDADISNHEIKTIERDILEAVGE